jgi:hypothetical protein
MVQVGKLYELGGPMTEMDEVTLAEIDRNARAYGYEVGRGRLLAKGIETSEDNPFLDPNWRDHVEAETSVGTDRA